jgi:hypothetical protein
MEIERRLRSAGFEVRRWESTQVVSQSEGAGRTTIYNEASAPYVLRLSGSAIMDSMHRCFGGGFNFEYITAEIIDVRSNQSLGSYSGQGYSEGCPPLSGKIYANVTNLVVGAWSN